MTTLTPTISAALQTAVLPVLKQFGVSNASISIEGGPAFIVKTDPAPAASTVVNTQLIFDPSVTGRVVSNIVLTSPDGNGVGGIVRGQAVQIINVNFQKIYDGLQYGSSDGKNGCVNLTINGGGQIGNEVQGRCHFLIDIDGLTWTGDSTKCFGPASKQSPIRFSSPGVRNATITGVHVTQVGSPFPIACWAIHAANNVHWLNCTADGGEFSFDSAGEGVGDRVSNCVVENLTINNSKLNIGAVTFGCTFKGGKFTNPTGEAISVQCVAGSKNVIDGASIYSSSGHAIHFYAASDLVMKNCTFYRTNHSAVLMDGAVSPQNDGGGNKIVDV